MTPEFKDWASGATIGYPHEQNGKGAQEAHDSIIKYVHEHPTITAIEESNRLGGVCESYPNKYGSPDNSDGDFDPEAKRYDKYWKRILRQRKAENKIDKKLN